jgi:hypothetical protein
MMTRRAQQGCGTICLLAFLLASQGLIPSLTPPPIDKDHADTFACASHGCGCLTAEVCWKQCCCFTQAERLAWAAKHDVAPLFSAASMVVRVSATSSPACHVDKPGQELKSPMGDPEPAGPSFSPLKCQGLWQWIVVAVPFATPDEAAAFAIRPEPGNLSPINPDFPLLSQILDVITPPPRA